MKYSVIIPAYNAEKTLERCLDSLLREKREDAEIILVNDGSRDGSGEIGRRYAGEHPNVVYLEKENGGVSTARNMGLDHARGEYVAFVDSDDYAAEGFFALADEALEEQKADWTFFACCFDNEEEKQNIGRPDRFVSGRKELLPVILDAICRKTINGPVAKIYRREIISDHQLRFPVGASVAEDRVFNICYSFYINSLQISNRVLYCVKTDNKDSLSRKRHQNLQEQFSITDRYFYDALNNSDIPEEEKEQYRRAVNFGKCRYVYHEAKLLFAERISWLERQKRLDRLCAAVNRKQLKYPKTWYCTLITFPVRLRLTVVIDAIAWKLSGRK